MTQIATVEKLLPGGYAEISVPRKTACGHDCEECAGCGMTGAAIKARAKNDPNAQPGEKVVVESSTKKLLGVVALAGIVVNNAIVLIDVIDQHLQRGQSPEEALAAAVARRIRPILLTTATTVAGLLPLTFTRSTLWPPMAWSIISGLIASTLLPWWLCPL